MEKLEIKNDELETLSKFAGFEFLIIDKHCKVQQASSGAKGCLNIESFDDAKDVFGILSASFSFESIAEMREVIESLESKEIKLTSNRLSSFHFKCVTINGDSSIQKLVLLFRPDLSGPKLESYLQREKHSRDQRLAALNIAKDAEEARRMLEIRTRELQESNLELERYAYVVSHDLQTPVRHMWTYAQLLTDQLRNNPELEVQGNLEGIGKSCSRLQKMIQELFRLSRIGKSPLNIGIVDVGEKIEMLKPSLLRAGADAEIIVEDKLKVFADETLLIQLFQNLIENSLKFSASDRKPQIKIGKKYANLAETQIYIQDNGIGIKTEHFERIFQIFQRLYSREKYPGDGVGLAICKRIVGLHGGRIWVESVENEGSTFYITMPNVIDKQESRMNRNAK